MVVQPNLSGLVGNPENRFSHYEVTAQFTAQLICAFVFAYAKNRFSHDAARMSVRYLLGAVHTVILFVY